MIEVKNISKSFGTRKILDGISLKLDAGQITVLLGQSGGGKTTLLRSLTLLDQPDLGEWTNDAYSFSFPSDSRNDFSAIYPEITVVFQQFFLWPHLTNRQNIVFATQSQHKSESSVNMALNKLIEKFEMKSYIDNYPNQSSSGQKQRVAIARALILNPKFIFFDEITSSLDILQSNKMVEIIRQLRHDGIGVFLITHNLEIARLLADQVLFLENGNIVEQGTLDILRNPKSKELCNFLGK